MTLVRGIDVHPIYQRITDWARVARSVAFVYVKLTEGRGLLPWQRDSLNDSHAYLTFARAAGLLVGGYHVCHPGGNTPGAEAAFYVDQLEQAGWRSGRGLPPVLDVEPLVFLDEHMTGPGMVAWAQEFCQRVDAMLGLTGPWLRTGVYVGESIFKYFDWRQVIDGRWFWHGGYPLDHWPTSMPSTPAAVYQRVGPVSLVPGVSGSGLDVDIARSEDLARLAPGATIGEDMQLSDKVSIADWIKGKWDDAGLQDGTISVNTALGSGYGHARRAGDYSHAAMRDTAAIRKELAAAKLRQEALLFAVQGLDTAAVLTRIDQHAAEETARAQAEAERDAQILALLDQHATGVLDAAAVVRRIGELLTA